MEEVVLSSRENGTRRVQVVFAETGRTKPEFKDSCDINYILERYLRTGALPISQKMPSYGDYSDPVDFQTAQNLLIKANQQFDSLPAEIRKRFGNDPKEFLEFVSNPGNKEEAVKIGLIQGEEVNKEPEIVNVETPAE